MQFSLFGSKSNFDEQRLGADAVRECALPEEDVKQAAGRLYRALKAGVGKTDSAVYKKFAQAERLKVSLLQLG